VHFLKKNGASRFDSERKTELRHEFEELLKDQGCTLVKADAKADLDSKLNAVLTAALVFGQTSAGQRAVYQLSVPRLKAGELKTSRGTTFTSIDEEFGTADEEEFGEIWYVGRPGLLRRGSPWGENLEREWVPLQKPFVMLKIDRSDSR
jgi:hypothetical protein